MANHKTLGKFDIIKTLGKGGMGTVYLGYDKKLHRHVAIKTIRHEELVGDELLTEYARRFELEAKAIAKLNHPNIVSVYDSGEEGDTAYLVMEFVEGHDLKYYFDKKIKFELAEALRLTIDLLEALAHAHDKGVWHRDIKPANVMIDAKGQIKLTDFGVSRITDNTERSRVGTMVGTLHYMSPEQVLNTGVTHLSDIFAAAVIMYELLTQTRPFAGSDFEISNKIVRDNATPPSQIAPNITPRLDAILAKAMAKQPDQRYANAKDFVVDLKIAITELKEPVIDHDATMCFYASHGSKNTVEPLSSPDNRPRIGSTTPVTHGSGSNATATAPSENAEIEFWRSIKDSTDSDEFSMYLSLFPQGTYTTLARKRIEKLSDSKPVSTAPTSPTAAATAPTAGKTEPSFGNLRDEDIAADTRTGLANKSGNEKKRPAWLIPIIFLSVLSLGAAGFWLTNQNKPSEKIDSNMSAATAASTVPVSAPVSASVANIGAAEPSKDTNISNTTAASTTAAAVVATPSVIATPNLPAPTVIAPAKLPPAANQVVNQVVNPAASVPRLAIDTEKKTADASRQEIQRPKDQAQAEKLKRDEKTGLEPKKNALALPIANTEPTNQIHNCLLSVNMNAGDSNKTDAESCILAKAKANSWVEQWKSPAGASRGWDKYHGQDIGECKCQSGICTIEVRFLKQQVNACD